MNKGLLTGLISLVCTACMLAQNPHGDLRIEMFDYYNLVVDHNVTTPAGASPRAVYIGVKICNDGGNDLNDVFAYIGDYNSNTPGIYPTVTHSSGPFTGTFSFTHEGGTQDATRYIGDLAGGDCITQYWLLSYPLVDGNNNNITGSKPDQEDDLHLTYNVWTTGLDNGNYLEAEDSKTVHLRAMLSASANKIWPNTTSHVPNEFESAFPDKELGWRMTTDVTHPSASVVLEGIWFDCGVVNKGFDNDGDYQYDYNFMLQPIGNPAVFDPNCYRLVKVSGIIVVKPKNGSDYSFDFEDQLHFENLPINTGAVGMVFYEFAILDGPCSADLTPYQAAASGKNNEKFNSDFGLTGGTLNTPGPTAEFDVSTQPTASPGDRIEITLNTENVSAVEMGMPQYGANLVIEAIVPDDVAYVSGSADDNNTFPGSMTADVLYSTDDGLTWSTAEPVNASEVDLIQWWLSEPLQPTEDVTVTYDVDISPLYSEPTIIFPGELSVGNRDPFLFDEAIVALVGGYSINGVVFNDNGDGNSAGLADGIQSGNEPGISDIKVEVYTDLNNNGKLDNNDILLSNTNSLGDGSYFIGGLSDGKYIVVVDNEDADLDEGMINTTPLFESVTIAGGNATVNFGFAIILDVTNTLLSDPIVSECDIVDYQVSVSNLSYTVDADNSSTVIAWASALDVENEFNNNPNNLLGAPDVELSWPSDWGNKAKVKGFDFGTQTGTIEKVEIIISLCLDYSINNDYLTVAFQKESGGIAYVPDPVLGKNSTPSLNDYVGPPNIGWLILDVTDIQEWDWDVFDSEWAITMDGIVVSSNDGAKQYTDAIGVRVTTTCCPSDQGEPGDCQSTLTHVPLRYEYDNTKLEFLASVPPADAVADGVITFDEIGPLYPNETKLIDFQFKALNPLVVDNNCTLPEPVDLCDPPSSGYDETVTVSGNVNWSSILAGTDPADMDEKIRITGTGSVTVTSGDLKMTSSSSLLVVEGVDLIISNGELLLENNARAIFKNMTLRTAGNITQKIGSYLCVYDSEIECGDEQSNGYFSGNTTSANFSNDGGTRHLENVCLNVTQNYELQSTSGGKDVWINVCAEIGDQGVNDAATGIVDGSDSGNFSISKSLKIFNSNVTVIENVDFQSSSSVDVCATNFRTLNGNFQCAGTIGGYDLTIWVDGSHSIQKNGGTWTATIEARRGSSTGSIPNIPANSSISEIQPHFANCSCSGDITAGDPNATATIAYVNNAENCDSMQVSDSDDANGVTLVNLGSVNGYVFGDADGDGWKGVFGYEQGVDNFIPGVEINLYGCVDDNGDLIYDNAGNLYRRCTHSNNGGNWELIKRDTTDENGFYELGGIRNGYYYLEVDETTLSNASDQTADPDITNGLAGNNADNRWKDPNEDLRDMGIIGIGNDHTHINFGYFIYTTIAGTVWNDINGDGVKDQGEPVIPNVKVEFNHSGCTTGVDCEYRYTNGQGKYELKTALPDVDYSLSIDLDNIQGADSWAITFEADGTTDNANAVTVSEGQQVFNIDFGVQANGPLSLGGTVYYDWIGNAHQDLSDEGMPNVKLRLYKDNNHNGTVQPSDQLVQTVYTDINGNYLFENKPSDSYVIVLDEGSVPIFPKQTEDPDEYGPCTVCDAKTAVAVSSEEYKVNVADVWDYYNYNNANCEICDEGYTSSSDPPYLNNDLDIINFNDPIGDPSACVNEIAVTFNIAASDFDKSYNTSQVDNVNYFYPIELNGVLLGTFNPTELPYWCGICESITVKFPVDLNAIGYNFGGNNTLDINFRSYNLSMPSDQRQDMCVADIGIEFLTTSCTTDYLDLDFGYQPTGGEGEVTGVVYLDENSNGVMNNDEQGIPNVEVQLETDLNEDGTYHWVQSCISDSNGVLQFQTLIDGNYNVVINAEDADLPVDYSGEQYFLTTDSAFISEIELTELISVGGNPCNGPCDIELPAFGFALPGAATGFIFSDNNGNGQQDFNEPGLSNVQVYICNAVDGYCDATNALDTVQSSNGSGVEPKGFYIFSGLHEGDYVIAVDVSTVPNGYKLTADPTTDGIPCYSPLDINDPNYTLLNAECDNQTNSINIRLGSLYAGANFGYQPPGSVGGTVWFDENENGLIDDDEDGLVENKVELTNLTSITVAWVTYDPGEYVLEEYTDIEGNYVFTNLPDGTYQIDAEVLVDYYLTYEVDGVFDQLTQVVVSSGDVTSTGNSWCSTSDCSMTVDYGMSRSFVNTLSGFVCLDGDEDGRCDTGGELFPEGTIVTISNLAGESFGETEVEADGSFFFDNLPTADMVVSVSKKEAPLILTTLTTSLGDTPAYDIQDSDDNALQYVSVSGDVVDMHYGFTFDITFDLGDLPAPFPTTATGASPGPVHILPAVPDLYLGSLVDTETFPTLLSDASGDDVTSSDDEDGVTFSDPGTWLPGLDGGSLTINVVGTGYLIGFADFNFDGDFNDYGELIISESVTTGVYPFNFNIPSNTDLSGGQDFYFRFRIFESQPFSPSTSYNGIVNGGEVEDYMVSICKNIASGGSIGSPETGCNSFDPAPIIQLTAAAGGGGVLEFIWEQSTDGGLNWTVIPGATASSYDPGTITQTTRYRRGARRSRCTDYIYSNSVIKTVVTNYTNAGLIVGDEDNCGIYDPDIILNVAAPSGGIGNTSPHYQWEQSTDGGSTWNHIANANDEYYDPGVISQTTLYRRGATKTPCGAILYSNTIKKMVSVNYVNAGTIAGGESVCGTYDPTEITSVTMPSGGVDGYEVIQWEQSTNNGASWSDIAGATNPTYDPGLISQTTLYRRKARRVPCTVWVNSNVISKTVRPFPTANIDTYPISASGYLCELTDYEFAAENAGTGVNYSWDFGSLSSLLSAVGQGVHQLQFDVPDSVALSPTQVTLTTSLNGCESTDNRVFTFRPLIIIDSITTVDPSMCQTNDGTLEVHATYPDGTNIEYSVNGGITWSINPQFNNMGAGVYDVQVRYQGGDCVESYGSIGLSDPPPQADITLSSIQECTGQTIIVEATPTNGNPTFTWAFGNGAIPNTASGAGPHSIYFNNGGVASIAITMEESNCIGIRDTTVSIVENYSDGGSILGGETLCSTSDPSNILGGANPSGGTGGSLVYQWEYREDDGMGGYTSWSDIAGTNAASYDPSNITATTEFRRKARRSPCSDWVVSNTIVARLVQKPNLVDDNYFTVCPGFAHADNVSENDLNLVNASYSLLVFPTNGVLDFEADGEFIYDPNSTYCGTDEFQYLVCNDGTSCCDTAQVVIDLTDNTPPVIQNVPNNITISCDDQIPLADAVDVVEECQTVSIGTDVFTTQGTDSCALNTYQITRVWKGVDYCSNSATSQQVITIEDNTAPDIYRIYTLPNGQRMVAGVMENVSQHWKNISFPIQFSQQPVVFTQLITRNDLTPATTKIRNVSTTQFQLKLKEEEANDGIHAVESVAWIAIEKGTYTGTSPFEIGTWLLNSSPTNYMFNNSFAATPDFFLGIQTNNEADPANPRMDNLTGIGVDVWIQEETSADSETTHDLETVGYMARLGTGDIKNINGEVIGEMGRLSLTNASLHVNLDNKYHNPVVIMGSVSTNEFDPNTVRVSGVTSTGFDVFIEEWAYLDGVHVAEDVSYMVIEGSLPLDRTVACDAIPAPLNIGTEIVAIDNCDATIQLLMIEDDYGFDCETDTTFTRTWVTVDDCGNLTSMTEMYILIDTVPPTFTTPSNVTIVCNANKDDLSITGDVLDEMDNCSDFVTMNYTDDISSVTGCNGYIVRTWTAEDGCGNQTVKLQLIYISPDLDTDRDGVVDYFDLDDDDDGIPDVVETDADFDNDGIPNDKDLDSDNDGIPDLIEMGGIDVNGDGMIDHVGEDNWDNDGDGFAFGYDGNDIDTSVVASVVMDPLSIEYDRDEDGVPNFLDRDSDNDGIPDLVEVGGLDTNGDGLVDYEVLSDPSTFLDADNDGFFDRYDPDIDLIPGDELPKNPLIVFDGSDYGGGLTTDDPDPDGDLVPSFLDNDSDNDGTGDLIEAGGIDENGDGKLALNASFVDVNNDGYSDVYATYPLVNTEGDGQKIDGRPEDIDGDGTVYPNGDADSDGTPNHLDLDSDDDQIFDILETGLSAHDGDGDGVWDNWMDTNQNGFDDIAEASGNTMTEGEGTIPDGRPEDSGDSDLTPYLGSVPDGTFAETNGNPDVDDDEDGILNFLDTDSDNDLLPDSVEDDNHNGALDDGETGMYNPDSDFDLILDGVEDHDKDGRFEVGETDPLNPNTDGDFFQDGEEDLNYNGQLDPTESDPTDPCDPILNEACRGVVLDIKVKLLGALIDQDSLGLMRDDLRFFKTLPEEEPYTGLAHLAHIGEDNIDYSGNSPYPGGVNEVNGNVFRESINPGMIYITGIDAPVDWVMVELRDPMQADSVIATRAGLLQRDGDIRDIDGLSYLTFHTVPSGNYRVAVRHRNHLGIITSSPYLLSPVVTTIDFTKESTSVHGENARSNINGLMSLWPGDMNGDGNIIFQGPGNDINVLFQEIILNDDNADFLANFIVKRYSSADYNLDGNVIYQGPNNEKAKLLIYSILSSPENSMQLANFVISEKLP